MRIDKGRCEQQVLRVQQFVCIGVHALRNFDDPAVLHSHRHADAPVRQTGVAYKQIEHDYLVPNMRSPASPNPGKM